MDKDKGRWRHRDRKIRVLQNLCSWHEFVYNKVEELSISRTRLKSVI